MITAILAILLFVILIFPHELGHFIAAKAVGVQVNEFSFGMGPALWKHQKGETLYSIRAFPIGGYCAMEGENEESDNERAFNNKPGWAKIIVLVAGSFMNVLIALVIMSIMMGYYGAATTTIDTVAQGSPAAEAGILSGDRFLSADGKEVEYWTDLQQTVSDGKPHSFVMLREGSEVTVDVQAEKTDDRYIIGVTPMMDHSPGTAIRNGAVISWNMVKTLKDVFQQLFTGQVGMDEMSGPVGMVSVVHENQSRGMQFFFYLLAFISLNLAIFNMLPLPALDGGRILFVIIRTLTGRMISDELEARIHGAGMLLLLALMVFVTWNDITRLLS